MLLFWRPSRHVRFRLCVTNIDAARAVFGPRCPLPSSGCGIGTSGEKERGYQISSPPQKLLRGPLMAAKWRSDLSDGPSAFHSHFLFNSKKKKAIKKKKKLKVQNFLPEPKVKSEWLVRMPHESREGAVSMECQNITVSFSFSTETPVYWILYWPKISHACAYNSTGILQQISYSWHCAWIVNLSLGQRWPVSQLL